MLKGCVEAVLEGHLARVNCAEFSPRRPDILISTGDDRTFKVWNISEGCLLFQSSIVSSSPFLCLAFNPTDDTFAVGSADGQVRVVPNSQGRSCYFVLLSDVFEELFNV